MANDTTEKVIRFATLGRRKLRPCVCIADDKCSRGLPESIVPRKLREVLGVIVMILIAFSVVTYNVASAEPVLLLNPSHEIGRADSMCDVQYHFLLKLRCREDKLCQRAINVIATCKAHPAREARAFYNKLLNHFANNSQCQITIIHLSGRVDPSDAATAKNDYETYEWATWELVLRFIPGIAKQRWWLRPGPEPSGFLEGEGDAGEIVREVCAIVTRAGGEISN